MLLVEHPSDLNVANVDGFVEAIAVVLSEPNKPATTKPANEILNKFLNCPIPFLIELL